VRPDTGKADDNGAAVRLAAIKAQRRTVARAERCVDDRAADLAEAKGALKVAMQGLIGEIDDDQLPLAFSEPKDSEAWREEAVITLGLPEGIMAKLAQAGIVTLGQLDTHCKTNQLFAIKGIGKGACENIGTALEEYWAEHGMVSNVDGEGEPIEVEPGIAS
jgi:hypothetical protein